MAALQAKTNYGHKLRPKTQFAVFDLFCCGYLQLVAIIWLLSIVVTTLVAIVSPWLKIYATLSV